MGNQRLHFEERKRRNLVASQELAARLKTHPVYSSRWPRRLCRAGPRGCEAGEALLGQDGRF